MLKVFKIPERVEFHGNNGWEHDFYVNSMRDGSGPADWDNMTVQGYLCNPNDISSKVQDLTVAKGAAGAFTASLSQALLTALAVGEYALVFQYQVAGDTNVYPLAIGDAERKETFPLWS